MQTLPNAQIYGYVYALLYRKSSSDTQFSSYIWNWPPIFSVAFVIIFWFVATLVCSYCVSYTISGLMRINAFPLELCSSPVRICQSWVNLWLLLINHIWWMNESGEVEWEKDAVKMEGGGWGRKVLDFEKQSHHWDIVTSSLWFDGHIRITNGNQ